MQFCIQSPHECKTHFPLRMLNEQKIHCILTSYLNDVLSCPMQLTHNEPSPFLHFSNLKALYSVPTFTQVKSICTDSPTQAKDIELFNSGLITLLPGCKYVFTCNNHQLIWFTSTEFDSRTIPTWHTFENLKLRFASKNVSVILPNEIVKSNLNLTLKQPQIDNWNTVFRQAFHPKKSIPIWIQVIIGIISFAILFILLRICYCIGLLKCKFNRIEMPESNSRQLPPAPPLQSIPITQPVIQIPTYNTADTNSPKTNYRFQTIPMLNMQTISDSMSNLDLIKIEESAFTPPLPRKFRPNLATINESYVEMSPPLLHKVQFHKAHSDETLQNNVPDSVIDHPHYATLPPRFAPRFPLTENLAKIISKTDPDVSTIH